MSAALQVESNRWLPAVAVPWRERSGRFSPLKASVFLLCLTPGLVLAARFGLGDLGARPLHELILGCGLWTIRFLLITLALTPLRRIADWPQAALIRRMVGLTALGYALAHLTLYVTDQNFQLGVVASEIARRIYLTIGFAVVLGLSVLGATSTDGWMRRLKRRWKRLHRIVYVLAALGILHFFMQAKSNVSEPVVMAGLFTWLMLWRALPSRQQTNPLALASLAPVVVVTTAGIEFAWYALATNLPAWRVLLANLNWALAPRPAAWAGVVALAIAMLATIRFAVIPKRAKLRPA